MEKALNLNFVSVSITISIVNSKMLYSNFSLRPPLPRREEQMSIIIPSLENDDASNDERGKKIRRYCVVESSFLYRMYVACHILRVKTETRFTALVLLHRYAFNSSQGNYDNKEEENNDEILPWIGAACLFLACKTEEEPRRLRDVINMARMVLSSSSSTSLSSLSTASSKISEGNILFMNLSQPVRLNEKAYWDSKKKVIETEQLVLRWLGYDCSVSHPHRAVYWILQKELEPYCLTPEIYPQKSNSYQQQSVSASSSSTDKNKSDLNLTTPIDKKRKYDNALRTNEDNINKVTIHVNNTIQSNLLSSAFRRLNDALFYPKALQWGTVVLACAALDLSANVVEVSQVTNRKKDRSTSTTNNDTASSRDNERDIDRNNDGGGMSDNHEFVFLKNHWWKRYEVSDEDFNGCRKSLLQATSYLEHF